MCPYAHVTRTENAAPIATSDYDELALNIREVCANDVEPLNTWDFAAGLLLLPRGTTPPATCTVGTKFFDTDASPNEARELVCCATDTWCTGGSGSAITIEEQDGTPTGTLSTLKVTNGTLTDDGAGVFSLVTGGGAGGAPADAQYVVGAADATLSAERVLTSTASTTVDSGTAGQMKLHVEGVDADNDGTLEISSTAGANVFLDPDDDGVNEVRINAAGNFVSDYGFEAPFWRDSDVSSCIDFDGTNRPYNDEDCSATKGAGEEYLDEVGGGSALIYDGQTDDSLTGTLCVGDGCQSMSHTAGSDGYYTTGVGRLSLFAATTGYANTAIGFESGKAINTGYSNSILGADAGELLTTGYENTAIGASALASGVGMAQGTAVGFRAARLVTGNANTAIGHESMAEVSSSGSDNVAVGQRAGYRVTSGSGNAAVGKNALYGNQGGLYNVGVGMEAGYNKTGGSYGVYVGYQSGFAAGTGSYNTAIGTQALYSITNPAYNVGVGYQAGNLTSGGSGNATSSNSVYIGSVTRSGASGNTNEIVIGYNAYGQGSNTVTLGATDVTDVYMAQDGEAIIHAGPVLARRSIEASTAGSGAPNVLTNAESNKMLTNEGATAEAYNTLPTAVAGLTYSACVQDADGLRVTADTGDTIRIEASASATAGYINSTTIGSCVELVAINATEWFAVSVTGTWSVN